MRYILFVLCLSVLSQASAIEAFGAHVTSFQGSGWQLKGINAEMTWIDLDQLGLDLSIRDAVFDGADLRFKNIKIRCPKGHVSALKIDCPKGKITLYFPKLKQNKSFGISFNYAVSSQRLTVTVRRLAFAGGRAFFTFWYHDGHWRANVTLSKIQLPLLVKRLSRFNIELPATDFAGQFSVTAQLNGTQRLHAASAKITLQDISATDNATFALDGLGGVLNASTKMVGDNTFTANLSLNAGEVTLVSGDDTLYKTFLPDDPGTLKITGQYRQQRPMVSDLTATLPGVDLIAGKFGWHKTDNTLDSAEIQLSGLSLATLPDSVERFAEQTLSGQISVNYSLTEGQYHSAIVALRQVSFEDPESEVGFSNAEGRILWHNRQNPVISRLSWASGHLKKINIGPAKLIFSMKAGELKLEKPAQIPILDGRLMVDQLHFKGVGETDWQVDFVGKLLPISLLNFSQAMGWPPLAGKLSGAIPGVTHEGKRYTLDGELVFNAFDGRFVVKHLVLDDILGAYPIIRADVDAELDLRLLTKTFDIGAITGRLAGYIRDFVMEDGVVTGFKAKFATPEDDDSDHSISQRAVDNITNLGGSGMAGALSRSFLRFFDTFSYDRLGISCYLHDGVCEMGGVEDSENGYYIVKGAGIPRIDIKGFNGSVDWQTLIEELKLAIDSNASVE